MDNFDENGGWDFDNLDARLELVFDVVAAADCSVVLVDYSVVLVDYSMVVVDCIAVVPADYIADAAGTVILGVPPILAVVDVSLAPDGALYFSQYDDILHICIAKIGLNEKEL